MIAFKNKALLSLAIAGLVSTQVQAASISGSMDLKVTMPEVLVLYHFDEVQIDLADAHTVTAANDNDDHEISEGDAGVVNGTMGTPVTAALGIVGTDSHATTNQTVNVTLSDAWAIRTIASGNVTVTGSIQTTTLTHDTVGTSTIGVSAMTLTSGGTTAATVSLAPQWALQTGDISFELDLTTATHAGLYQSAATASPGTDTFLLTLTGI